MVPPLDQLVHRHVKALYDFLRGVYPAAEVDRCIDATFASAARYPPTGSEREVRLWLFAEARAQLHDVEPTTWRDGNAELVCRALREQGNHMADWHAWKDLNRLLVAFQALSTNQQELLNISMAVDGASSDELALVLRIGADEAHEFLNEARSALRAAFDQADPAGESNEARP